MILGHPVQPNLQGHWYFIVDGVYQHKINRSEDAKYYYTEYWQGSQWSNTEQKKVTTASKTNNLNI